MKINVTQETFASDNSFKVVFSFENVPTRSFYNCFRTESINFWCFAIFCCANLYLIALT